MDEKSGPMSKYPENTGPFAHLDEGEKKKRLDAMVALWQSETQRRIERAASGAGEELAELLAGLGLDEYRYAVWLRFPEWERSVVVGQVVTLRQMGGKGEDVGNGERPEPVLLTVWRHEPLLRRLSDWKERLPKETVLNICVRITPGSLGEGSKWAVIMPKDMIPRYRSGWSTQREWVEWTQSFDWLSVGVGFIRALLDM